MNKIISLTREQYDWFMQSIEACYSSSTNDPDMQQLLGAIDYLFTACVVNDDEGDKKYD